MSELENLKKLLANYEELLVDMVDDDAYIARGNGFCDAKYSDDFLEGRIAEIKEKIVQLERNLPKE